MVKSHCATRSLVRSCIYPEPFRASHAADEWVLGFSARGQARNKSKVTTRKPPQWNARPKPQRQPPVLKAQSDSQTLDTVEENSEDASTPIPTQAQTRHLPREEPLYAEKPIFTDIKLDVVRPAPYQDLTSSRPAPLETPNAPEPISSNVAVPLSDRGKYFYGLGKAYLGFYKTGFKNVWRNYKEYRNIKKRLQKCPITNAAWYGGQTLFGSQVPVITRREYQLYLRTRHDIRKLLPFGLVFAICGEFTPFVILAIGSSVVPYTCRIPKQVDHDRRKHFERLKNPKIKAKLAVAEDQVKALISRETQGESSTEIIGRNIALSTYYLGLAPLVRPPFLLKDVYVFFWAGRRLKAWGKDCLSDLILIRREGGFRALEPIEVLECAQKLRFPPWLKIQSEALSRTGNLDWDTKHAQRLIPMLERFSDKILDNDWTRLAPDNRDQLVFKAIMKEDMSGTF